MPDPITIEAKVVVTSDAARAALKDVGSQVQALGSAIRRDLSGASNEATAAHGGLLARMKEMKTEGVQATRMFGFYGQALADVGIGSKGAAQEIGGLVAALAGGSILLGIIEAVRMVGKEFSESKKHIKEFAEEMDKIAEPVRSSLNDVGIEIAKQRMLLDGASKADVAAWEANAKATKAYDEAVRKLTQAQRDLARGQNDKDDTISKAGGVQVLTRNVEEALARVRELKFDLSNLPAAARTKVGNEEELASRQKAQEAAKEASSRRRQELEREAQERAQAAAKMATERAKILREAETLSLGEREKLWREYDENLARINEHDIAGRLAAEQIYMTKLAALHKKEAAEAAKSADEVLDQMRAANSQVNDEQARKAQELAKLMQPVADSMAENLAAMMEGTKSATQAIGDFWRSTVDYVLSQLARLAVNFIFSAILKAVGGVAGAAAGAGLSAIGGRASGGPVSAGTPYWVGERGVPELFVPSSSGTVVSGASTSTTVHFHVYANDAKSFEQMISSPEHTNAMLRWSRRVSGNGRR